MLTLINFKYKKGAIKIKQKGIKGPKQFLNGKEGGGVLAIPRKKLYMKMSNNIRKLSL